MDISGRGITIALAGTCFVLGAGCGRTGLDGGHATAGASSGGSGGAGAMMGTGGSGIGGATTAPPDAAPGPDTRPAACVSVPATSPCLAGPSVATRLASLDGDLATGLASSGDAVFAATSTDYDIRMRGWITRIALPSGAVEKRDFMGKPLALQVQAQTLVYKPSFYNPSDPFEEYAPSVLQWDLKSGQTTSLPNPADFTSPNVRAVTANAKGEVFWALVENNRTAIARWQPCATEAETMVDGHDAVELLADESTVYWQQPVGGRGFHFTGASMVLAAPDAIGGASTILLDIFTPNWNDVILWALDASNLYYRDPRQGFVSTPKHGGPGRVLTDVFPTRPYGLAIDGADVYWIGVDAPYALLRRPTSSGKTESLWSADRRPVEAIAVDACNVYWVAANPREVYYRAK